MTPLHLSSEQHRALWHKLSVLREASRELAAVRDHKSIMGFGSLKRRQDRAEDAITIATGQIAVILETAAEQTEQRQ